MRELLAHSLQAKTRTGILGQEADHVPAGLWLVGGHGIYLMSNGHRATGQHGGPVAYALEANPHDSSFDDWWPIAAAFGPPGDFSHFLPAVDVQAWLDASFDAPRFASDGEYLELVDDLHPAEIDE